MIQKVFFWYGNGVQGSFCACAQPMRDHVTLWCCLSLAGHMHKMISRGIFALKNLYNNRSKNSGIAMHELLVLIVCLWTPYGIAKLGNYCFSFLVCCLFGAVPLTEPMQTYSGCPAVREKSGKFQTWQKSGKSQGILLKVREKFNIGKSQGICI